MEGLSEQIDAAIERSDPQQLFITPGRGKETKPQLASPIKTGVT